MKAGDQWHLAPRPRKRSFLRWSGYLLCAMGIALLSYCGLVLLEAQIYQAYQSWRFEQAMKSSKPPASTGQVPASPAPLEATPAPAGSPAIPGPGNIPLGRIELKRIGIAAMIMEGIDNRTLRHAVGRFPGTALLGQPGNTAIAGHRDTFFRELRHVRLDDEITLTTLRGSYRYRVDSMLIVRPQEVWVLENTGGTTLTLVTCYPFNFVGPAPQRFIVRAHKISE